MSTTDSKRRVLAIGLDSADWPTLERMMAAGHLPNLRALRDRSAHWPLRVPEAYKSEASWTTFLTGQRSEDTRYWTSIAFDPQSYEVTMAGALAAEPWFALGDRATVIAIDIPHTILARQLRGTQVVGWGGHDLQFPRSSNPPGTLRDLEHAVGAHPGIALEYQGVWHQPAFVERFTETLAVGARRLVDVVGRMTSQRPDWDLLLVGMSEVHTAAHQLWFGIDPASPFHRTSGAAAAGAGLRAVHDATDATVGQLVRAVPADTAVVVFAVKGMTADTSDVAASVLVPELLHRAQLGERLALDPDQRAWRRAGRPWTVLRPTQHPTAYMAQRFGLSRRDALALRTRERARALASRVAPRRLAERDAESARNVPPPTPSRPPVDELDHVRPESFQADLTDWSVASWYRHAWPRMRAFALPSLSDVHIRLNVEGRERAGLVPRDGYASACDDVIRLLEACRDPRTGEPVLAEVIRLRADDPWATDGPPCDLAVLFDRPLDSLEHPDVGLIGPFPSSRTGAHTPDGFALIAAPDVPPGRRSTGAVVSLPATILGLLGQPADGLAPPLDELEGRSAR